MPWPWIIGAALLGVAALSIFVSFRSPAFVLGLVGAMLLAVVKAASPVIAKPLSPADTKAKNDAYRRGEGDTWLRRRQGGLKD